MVPKFENTMWALGSPENGLNPDLLKECMWDTLLLEAKAPSSAKFPSKV